MATSATRSAPPHPAVVGCSGLIAKSDVTQNAVKFAKAAVDNIPLAPIPPIPPSLVSILCLPTSIVSGCDVGACLLLLLVLWVFRGLRYELLWNHVFHFCYRCCLSLSSSLFQALWAESVTVDVLYALCKWTWQYVNSTVGLLMNSVSQGNCLTSPWHFPLSEPQ